MPAVKNVFKKNGKNTAYGTAGTVKQCKHRQTHIRMVYKMVLEEMAAVLRSPNQLCYFVGGFSRYL
jgi:hypothetical protein